MLPEDSSGLFKTYLDATKRALGYLLLDLTQDSQDRYRFRTNVFPLENPPIIYVALDDDEASNGKLSQSTRAKNAKTNIEESYNFGRRKELFNSINECVLNKLVGNIPLSNCLKRKLQ